MDKWEEFAQEMVNFVANLDINQVQYLPYAMTYAQHILVNIGEGKAYGQTPEQATKTQMIYVLGNLEGADESDLRKIENMCKKVGVDVSDAVQKIVDLND